MGGTKSHYESAYPLSLYKHSCTKGAGRCGLARVPEVGRATLLARPKATRAMSIEACAASAPDPTTPPRRTRPYSSADTSPSTQSAAHQRHRSNPVHPPVLSPPLQEADPSTPPRAGTRRVVDTSPRRPSPERRRARIHFLPPPPLPLPPPPAGRAAVARRRRRPVTSILDMWPRGHSGCRHYF